MVYSNLQIFTVELVGTFILVVFATGSIVYDAEVFDGQLGIPFAAVAPFIALLIGVYSFGKISLAHFNPAVTIGYYITGHISKIQVVCYFAAEIIGAILGSFFVLYFIGEKADLGVNAPNLDFPIFLIFPVEVLASAMLMLPQCLWVLFSMLCIQRVLEDSVELQLGGLLDWIFCFWLLFLAHR
jgi:aquaporin Z